MSTKSLIQIRRVESLNEYVQEVEDRIRDRAYERFVQRGGHNGDDLGDWYVASQEVIAQPSLTLSETDNQVVAMFSTPPNADSKDLEILATDRALLLRGTTPPMDIPGNIRIREFHPRQIFRLVELPQSIEPTTLRAEFHSGVVRVSASIAESGSSYQKMSA